MSKVVLDNIIYTLWLKLLELLLHILAGDVVSKRGSMMFVCVVVFVGVLVGVFSALHVGIELVLECVDIDWRFESETTTTGDRVFFVRVTSSPLLDGLRL